MWGLGGGQGRVVGGERVRLGVLVALVGVVEWGIVGVGVLLNLVGVEGCGSFRVEVLLDLVVVVGFGIVGWGSGVRNSQNWGAAGFG